MFSILRLFAGIIMKLMSNKVTNNGISGKFTHTQKHLDLAANLMNTSGYILIAINSFIHGIIFSENPFYISHISEY